MASSNVQLLYQHPHITLYLEDNTIQTEESTVESDSGLYGIQVGAFASGRDGVLLRYTNTDQYISELGECNHEVYGQAGYNAYRALNSKACGMYIMRVMPDDAPIANKVVMAKFKAVNPNAEEPEVPIDHVDNSVSLVDGLNPFSDMGSSAVGNFALYGKVTSGLTGDAEVDALFGHITPEWLNANQGLPKFSVATIRISVPNGVTPGANIKITQTSKALKTFYADFNEDPENITASGQTGTKVKTYPSEVLVPSGSINFDLSVLVQENDTISVSIEWNDDVSTVTDFTISTANVEFVDVAETVDELGDPVEEETPAEPQIPTLDISYYTISFPDIYTLDDMRVKYASIYNENMDEDGYYHMPLMMYYALGRGAYGNKLRIRWSDAMDYDEDTTPFRRYCITVMEITKNGLMQREFIRGSINETAWDTTVNSDGLCAYLKDLTNDVEYGSQKIGIEMTQQTIEKMLELYNTEVKAEEDDELTLDTFDPIFGLDMNGEELGNIVISNYDGDAGDPVNLEAVDGFILENGGDGSMTYHTRMTVEEQAVYDSAYEHALLRAFGDIMTVGKDGKTPVVKESILDKSIRSRYTTPADFMFDANFPDSVKMKMVELARKREYDCMTYLDSGMCQTATECVTWLRSMKDCYAYNVVKDVGCYKYRDSRFTRKVVPMTITHWLAGALPTHLSIYGIGEAFARKRARLNAGEDYIAGSFFPVIDPDDHEIKKQIYKYRGNCYESVNRNCVQRSSAITTCQEKSDRMEEFNEYILHRAVRLAYDIMNSNIYNPITDEKLLAYTEHAEKQISYNLAGLVTKVTIRLESDKADRKKSILRLVMRLEFTTVAKYGAVEIYLDPRGTEAERLEQLAAGY